MGGGLADSIIALDSFSLGLNPFTTLSSRLAATKSQYKRAF